MSGAAGTAAKPIQVSAAVAPAFVVQMGRLAGIAAFGAAVQQTHFNAPTMWALMADPAWFGQLGVGAFCFLWDGFAKLRLCVRLRMLAEKVDDDVAVITHKWFSPWL